MRTNNLVTFLFLLGSLLVTAARAAEPPWISLFDGKTLNGWEDQSGSAKVVDGQIVLTTDRADLQNLTTFHDFDFAVEVRTEPGAKGQISFDAYQTADEIARSPAGGPRHQSLEVAINNSRESTDVEKTGTFKHSFWMGLMDHSMRPQFKSIAQDGKWFKLRIWRQGNRLRIWVNEILLVEDYYGQNEAMVVEFVRRPAKGAKVANEAKIFLKNIRIQKLPSKPAELDATRKAIEGDAALRRLVNSGFPLINYHIHLKGDLTLEKALAHSREMGVFYGIAANCGVNFPITNDQGINEYIKKMEGQPCFVGMQAEGREWPTLFSKEAIARFDYIFTDAMTIVDHRGKRARLWIPEEVDIPDKQAFMELLVKTIEHILDNEPVDIYANPTYLPDMLIKEYDALWTPERVKRVIDAAARNGVAIEISNRLKLPKADFIRQAKHRGIKFTIGTNNVDSKLGREEYALQMIHECQLVASDMFLPKPDGKKPIQVRGFKRR
jgi:hypothetical protein